MTGNSLLSLTWVVSHSVLSPEEPVAMSSTQLESIFSSLKLAQTNSHNFTRQGWLRNDEFDIDFKWAF
jgi:hypothetical protein